MASANDTASGLLRAAALAGLLAVIGGNGDVRCTPAPVECAGEPNCDCREDLPPLVITEILPRSVADGGCVEWFEVYNPGEDLVDLTGWSVEDPVAGTRVVLDVVSHPIPARAYQVVAPVDPLFWCGDSLPRPAADYGIPYSDADFSLGLVEGGIVLRNPGGQLVDAVAWDSTWEFEPGRSLELGNPASDNAFVGNWRPATEVWGWETWDRPLYGTPARPPTPDGATDNAGPCDDGNPCTVDYCLAATGCTHVVSKDSCDDGDPCTDDDRCVRVLTGVLCAGIESHTCDDGCVEGEACDDGDPCTPDDMCRGGRCRGNLPSRYPSCDDPDMGLVGEGLCLPELGGVGYPIGSWGTGSREVWDVHCRGDADCAQIATRCADVACWLPTEQCMLLPY